MFRAVQGQERSPATCWGSRAAPSWGWCASNRGASSTSTPCRPLVLGMPPGSSSFTRPGNVFPVRRDDWRASQRAGSIARVTPRLPMVTRLQWYGPGMRGVRTRWWSRFLGVLLLLGLSAGVASGAPALELVQVGGARPFEAEYITEVMYDRVGLLWIGTREGLYLHDGQRFRKFQYELGNPASLASNAVRTLFEDRLGRLWVGTMAGGLSLVDRAHWSFKNFRHDSSDVTSLPHDGVFALADADDGQLWVGTSAGLALLDPLSGRAMRVPLVPGGGAEFVMALRHDRAGVLWAGTLNGGLFRLDPGTHAFEHVSPEEGGPDARDVFSLAPDLGGGMWVGTRAGLYRIGPGVDVLRRARLTPSNVVEKLRTVTELEPDGQGTLWVGSFGAGLFRVDTVTGAVSEERLPSAGPGYEQRIDEGSLA